MEFYESCTPGRQSEILTHIFGQLYGQLPQSAYLRKGDRDLVYWSDFREQSAELVDLSKITDFEHFKDEVMEVMNCLLPDILLFHKQEYIEDNILQTKVAGRPDLIIELRFFRHSEEYTELKNLLYSKSPVTELWQLTLDSNLVKRSIGTTKLKDLSLEEKLYTESGLVVNIPHLAL
ncbi:MAG: hypothetical protein FWG64_08010 [Firmicutes bacterium]|nr:hypothetical protein [Bacillota bacterium]